MAAPLFIKGVRRQRPNLIVGVRCDRNLVDGRTVASLHKAGSQVRILDLSMVVTVAWFYLKRDCAVAEARLYSLLERSKPAPSLGGVSGGTQIEGWFKTAKHR